MLGVENKYSGSWLITRVLRQYDTTTPHRQYICIYVYVLLYTPLRGPFSSRFCYHRPRRLKVEKETSIYIYIFRAVLFWFLLPLPPARRKTDAKFLSLLVPMNFNGEIRDNPVRVLAEASWYRQRHAPVLAIERFYGPRVRTLSPTAFLLSLRT